MEKGSISPVLVGASDEVLLEVERRRRGDQGFFSAESSVGEGWGFLTLVSCRSRPVGGAHTGRYTPLSFTTIDGQQWERLSTEQAFPGGNGGVVPPRSRGEDQRASYHSTCRRQYHCSSSS